ncbi:hypothetical protein GWK47_010270 [Chionoecetes opilio]|uniref:Fibronectin type-III domain-containing protein n=1 Tax=Chionoecetes opilio TaxID=41210 RepID=A0A8J4XXX1_CHIOP|nr:hypothetical protein GWK47_010270 [Chionoecetes opilio]
MGVSSRKGMKLKSLSLQEKVKVLARMDAGRDDGGNAIGNSYRDDGNISECSKGYLGADCSQRCHGCTSDECDPFSGTCLQGCEAGISCRKAFFLPTEAGPKPPVATITARHDGYTASWSDSGAIYFLSQEMLHQLSCIPSNTKRQQQHAPPTLLDTPAYSASNLLPHTSYNVCVVASSPEGLGLPWCTNVTTLTKGEIQYIV